MPDHIHLLLKLRTTGGSLSSIVAAIKATVRHDLRSLTDVIWMPGFYDRVKREYEEAAEFVDYIIQNPVRAGIVRSPEEYPFLGRPDCWR